MKNLPCMLLTVLASSCLAAEPLEPWGYPDPGALVKASSTLCEEQSKSAMLAWHLARKGRSREEVLALIPESPQAFPLRLTSAMRENIEDTFAYPEISQYTLYSFRAQVCLRETLGGVRMPRMAMIHDDLLRCQKDLGTERSNELFKCIQTAVKKMGPTQ